MKIALYSGNIPSTTFIENLIEGLADAGFEIILFGKKTRNVRYANNVKIHSTPESSFKLTFFVIKEFVLLFFKNPKLFIKSFTKILKRKNNVKDFIKDSGILLPIIIYQPDVFHIQWAKMTDRYPELFELLKCKTALSLRGAHINYSPITDKKLADSYRKYFPLIDGFHAVSEAISKEAQKYGADENKIKVIHSSVRDELLRESTEIYKDDRMIEIISIGRFHWKKGYHYALDAVKLLAEEGVNLNYTIVAQGEIPEEILFMIDDYKIREKVKIVKGLPYDKLIEKLKTSHLLLLPSVEEGIANVVLEAMAVGIPVITTDCGGMNEAVSDNINGYIVPVRSPEKIADKIIQFMKTDIDSKKRIVKNAKKTIEENFSREKQIKEFTGFYNSLIQ